MAVLLIAGVSKALDVPPFAASLAEWRFLPRALVPSIAYSVPSAELLIACCWFLGMHRRFQPLAAGALLIAFTAVYTLHLAFTQPPPCACFGQILRVEGSLENAWNVVLRNTILLALLAPAVVFSVRRPSELRSAFPPRRVRHTGDGRAFTLTETLIVIALAGILFAMALPSLRGLRDQARTAVTLSNLRSHTAVFEMYTADWKDCYPYYTDPRASRSVIRAGGLVYELPYFGAYSAWNLALADMYYDGEYRNPSFYAPGAGSDIFSSYWRSATLLADPGFWTYERRAGPEQWRAVHRYEVIFPSQKGLLLCSHPPLWSLESDMGGGRGSSIGFADGSARWVREDDIARGHNRGEGRWTGAWFPYDMPTLHTLDGVRGRDTR